MDKPKKEESKADHGYMGRLTRSELFHIWKKARTMYDMVKDEEELEQWVKNKVREAHDALDEAMRYTEYDKTFPPPEEEKVEPENNYLSNQDKRYPTPMEAESGDQFITRCITDANMSQRYPQQSDRFVACMLIFHDQNESEKPLSPNPGDKFNDPMAPNEPEIGEPDKPILP